jgi:putative phosphoesterase
MACGDRARRRLKPAAARRALRLGIIADTHGLLRAEAVAALRGAELIIHAGDIGRPEILEQLRAIAPLVAVRGNIDRQGWAAALPTALSLCLAKARLFILHDIAELEPGLSEAGYAAVIYGHSHRPEIAMRGNVLFLNPGSAGPRRFRLPVSVAHLYLRGSLLRARIVPLHL